MYQINFVVLELCFNIFLINCRLAVENFFTNFFWGFTKYLNHMSCIFFTFVFDFCDFMFRKPYKFLNREGPTQGSKIKIFHGHPLFSFHTHTPHFSCGQRNRKFPTFHNKKSQAANNRAFKFQIINFLLSSKQFKSLFSI